MLVLLLGGDSSEAQLLARRLGFVLVVVDDLEKEEQLGRLLGEIIAANSLILTDSPPWGRIR